jgi:hypothetical protein
MNIQSAEPPRKPNRKPPRWVLVLILLCILSLPAIPIILSYHIENQNKRLDKKLADVKANLKAVQAEQDSWKPTQELETIGMQALVTKLQTAFMLTDYSRQADTPDMRGELYYSLWEGPLFFSSEIGVLLAEPSKPADKTALQKFAARANASLDSKAIKGDSALQDELRKGRRIYVFYIAAELQQKIEAGDSVRIVPIELLSEEEFHKQFPNGEKAAYRLLRKPDGQYTFALQSQIMGTDISEAEAMKYVKEHGQPWTYERFETTDKKSGKKRVTYNVERYSVDFNAAKVSLVKIIRDNFDSVVAITSIEAEGKTEFVTDAKQVKKLVESLLRDEWKYQVDY